MGEMRTTLLPYVSESARYVLETQVSRVRRTIVEGRLDHDDAGSVN